MPKSPESSPLEPDEVTTTDPTKARLQQQMEETRESISQTVEQIKGTVGEQIDAVKKTVDGVLSIGQGFERDPIVWSLGALSAGFALGYTLGYANKHTKSHGRLPTPLAVFVDDLARELSKVGKDLVLPSLDAQIQSAFGFELSSVLEEIGGKRKRRSARVPAKVRARQKPKPKTKPRKSPKKKRSKRRG